MEAVKVISKRDAEQRNINQYLEKKKLLKNRYLAVALTPK